MGAVAKVKRDDAGRILPGQPSINPAGRPKSSANRTKIEKRFLRDVHELWKTHGKDILMSAALIDPVSIVRVVAALLPKTLEVDISEERIVSVRLLGIEEDPNEFIELRADEYTEVQPIEEMM